MAGSYAENLYFEQEEFVMLTGTQIYRVGLGILAIVLILSHSVGLPESFAAFAMGLGCSLSLVGVGKCFVEKRAE